jgi:hypothetical protein
MERPRHQFLTRARFAGDQHRHVGLRQPPDRAEHVLHGRRLTENLRRIAQAIVDFLFAQALFQRAADQLDRAIHVERLGEVFKRAALERRHGAVQIRIRGHDDDRQPGVLGLDGLQKIQPRAARHADVGNQDLRRFFVERVERVAHVGKAA